MRPRASVHLPADWSEAARRIRRDAVGRVLILGPNDVGKSTFARVLLDDARQEGRRAALVDADVGQKTVGPPAAVTLGYAGGDVLSLARLAFVGTTNPVQGWRRLISGVVQLTDEADANLTVVNTSGLLRGPGRRLKAAKIAKVRPDLLVAIGNDPSLDAILCNHIQIPALRLVPSPQARRKTDAARRAARGDAFRHYFTNASLLSLPIDRLPIENGPAPGALPPERLLVGLADAAGRDLAIAIVTASRPESGTLGLLVPAIQARPARLIWGAMCLDEDFSERRFVF